MYFELILIPLFYLHRPAAYIFFTYNIILLLFADRCEPLPTEPYMQAEVIKPGRDSNYTYSSGARIKISCLHGHGLNINKTGIAKCRRGHWKPMKPVCEPREYNTFSY